MSTTNAETKLPTGSASRYADKADHIVNGLSAAIFEHRLQPGAKLSEDEVGEIYGVSRTVVRAALQEMAHSELVTIEKHRGAFVARPSVREAREVFEARALIEPKVAAMAAARMTDQNVQTLHKHLDAEHAATKAGDKGKALALSGSFHLAIAEIAAHKVYAHYVHSLVSRSSLIIALYWKRPDTTCESHSHHALISAFEKQDEKGAEDVMRSHIVDLCSGLDLNPTTTPAPSLAQALLTNR